MIKTHNRNIGSSMKDIDIEGVLLVAERLIYKACETKDRSDYLIAKVLYLAVMQDCTFPDYETFLEQICEDGNCLCREIKSKLEKIKKFNKISTLEKENELLH